MTLAVGVCCPEGAVIAADSMRFSPEGPGNLGVKLVLPDVPWAGAAWSHWLLVEPRAPWPDDVQGGRQLLHRELRQACGCVPAGLASARPQSLLAGTYDGRVRLAFSDGEHHEWAPAAGAVYVAGLPCWPEAQLTLEAPDPPPTLAQACALAVGMVRDYIRRWFARDGKRDLYEYQLVGLVPPVAEPVQVAIVRPGHAHLEVLP